MAEKMVEQIRKKPNLVFCLSTGNSPIGMHEYLVQIYREGKADFSQLRTLDMDEYAGLTPDDSHSFIYFMHQHSPGHVSINMGNTRYPKADAAGLDTERRQRVQEIIDAGGSNIAVANIGGDGRIVLNEPGEYLLPHTHAVKMDEATRRQNTKAFVDCAGGVPEYTIAIDMEGRIKAKKYHVVCSGTHKGKLLYKLSENEKLDPKFPVSWLHMYPDVEFIIDKTTTAEIQEDTLEYYREK